MKRNKHKIVSARGQKYELSQDKWTTYANFKQMYDHIIEELVIGNIAEELDEPVWMDTHQNIVDEEQAFGCKVMHQILCPEWCVVGDKVGGNISMKGDSDNQKFLVCRRDHLKEKASSADQHFTLIGLTLLTGEPLMCIIIMKGTTPKADVEL